MGRSNNLIIQGNPDELSIEDAIATDIDFQEGFVYSIPDVHIKAKEFTKFIEKLSENDTFTKYEYNRTKNDIYVKYKSTKCRIYVRGNSLDYFMSVYSTSEEYSNYVWKVYSEFIAKEDKVEMFIETYFNNNNQVDHSTKYMKEEDLEYIDDCYYPYIDTKIMFEQFFTGYENILLVVGEPGLGKSKLSSLMLKFAFENPDVLPYDKLKDNPGLDKQFISVGYIKSTDILANDKLWRNLETNQHDFIIMDDLDYMLTKRDSEVTSSDDKTKNDFLNQFLSFTDGVEKNKTKFIITTNQKYSDIDSALLRKGRLFDILELRKLNKDEAMVVWKNNELPEDEFHKTFESDTVISAELGSVINKRLNTRIESSNVPYLKEDGISKVQKASKIKKIGL